MVHDALRNMEEKGIVPDQSWMEALKGASATSFLGTQFMSGLILAHPLTPIFKFHRRIGNSM